MNVFDLVTSHFSRLFHACDETTLAWLAVVGLAWPDGDGGRNSMSLFAPSGSLWFSHRLLNLLWGRHGVRVSDTCPCFEGLDAVHGRGRPPKEKSLVFD